MRPEGSERAGDGRRLDPVHGEQAAGGAERGGDAHFGDRRGALAPFEAPGERRADAAATKASGSGQRPSR